MNTLSENFAPNLFLNQIQAWAFSIFWKFQIILFQNKVFNLISTVHITFKKIYNLFLKLCRSRSYQVKPFNQDFHDVCESMLTLSQPIIFGLENVDCSFSSAACIQVHFRLDFIIQANNMNPEQTAPSSLIWVHIVCNICNL